MATLYATMIGLEEEMVQAIRDTVPDSKDNVLFTYITRTQQGDNPEDNTSLPRKFWIEWLPGRRETMGSSTSLRRLEGNIVVGYPAAAVWGIEPNSDSETLTRTLDVLSPTTTGVQFVECLDELQPEISVVGDDYKWVRTRFYAEAFVDD